MAARIGTHGISDQQNRRWAAAIARIAAGDHRALTALYGQASRHVFTALLRTLRDREAAGELLIEVFQRVRRSAWQFGRRGETAFTWLMTIARESALERLRADTSVDPLEMVRVDNGSFAAARLTTEQRAIIQLTYCCGLSVSEIAQRRNLPPGYVTQQIVIAMSEVRRSLPAYPQNPAESARKSVPRQWLARLAGALDGKGAVARRMLSLVLRCASVVTQI
jgi:DNA-directed RNA polymerase specialized sigma24 family protein